MSEPKTYVLDATRGLPLVVCPAGVPALRDAPGVAAWAAEHRDWLDTRLRAHGALLLRGLPLVDAAGLEEVTRSLCNGFQDYTRGNSPRRSLSRHVYTSTDLARVMVIPPHNELSYSTNHPARVFLFCHTPASRRGETPVADGRRVWRRLDPEIRARLAEHGVLYIQNLPRRRRRWRPHAWPAMFGTDRPDEVERICEGLGIQTRWRDDGALRLTNTRPAFIRHPMTGEEAWFNQANVFHRVWSTEMRRVHGPALAALFGAGEALASVRPAHSRPHHALYGDGREFGDDIESLRRALWEESVLVEWRAGDLLVLDNLLALHGRMPYRGARRILAVLGA